MYSPVHPLLSGKELDMRIFVGSVLLLTILAASVSLAQDRGSPSDVRKGKTAPPGKPLQYIDRNGNGFIEREEMTQAILAAPPVTGPDASSKTPPPPKPQDR
jgi:hypothetical protein